MTELVQYLISRIYTEKVASAKVKKHYDSCIGLLLTLDYQGQKYLGDSVATPIS
jgi:hypothetical protein